MVQSDHGLERSTTFATMEDVLDEVVSSEDLKVGEHCSFVGVFNISAVTLLLLNYKILYRNFGRHCGTFVP
jgi:hypothetical protein